MKQLIAGLALLCFPDKNGGLICPADDGVTSWTKSYPLVDTDRGTRIDNMLHCIMEFQFYGSYAVNGWQSICLNFLAENPLEK